jgi:hypothetical protein
MRGVANGGCRKETQKSEEQTQDDACRDEHLIEVSIELCHAIIVSVRRQSNSSSRHPRARSLGIPFPRSGAPPSVCEAFTSFSFSS